MSRSEAGTGDPWIGPGLLSLLHQPPLIYSAMPSSAPTTDVPLLGILQALADENRLRILEVLREGEHCVCELQSSLALAQSLLSHHLRALREAGLVHDRREGRWVYYRLVPEALLEVEEAMGSLRAAAAAATATRAGGCAP